MMIFTDTILPLCLAILFFILFFSSDKKDKSTLFMSLYFGTMLFDNWITNIGLKYTKFGTAWRIFYCILMVIFIILMTKVAIRNTKYIRERKRQKTLK